MKVIESKSPPVGVVAGTVLTIGNFDGVHIGHQEILTVAKQIAAEKKAELIVMTFEPHPLAVLNPQKSPGILTPLALKKYLIAEFGVDCLFILKTSPELLKLSPRDFVEEFLVKRIQPSVVVEGEDFNFGAGRTGGIDTLKELAAGKGFVVSVVDPKEVKYLGGRIAKISSTMIRNMLSSGEVADAAVALGRPYRLIEKIIPGRGKGKRLGFPTVNMKTPQQIIPAEGVYAGFVEIAGSFERICTAEQKIPAAFSIGRASTYGAGHSLLVEAHLLMENVGPLCGKWMAMDFIKRIRGQIKFDGEMQLAEQIAKDCEIARAILA
jgi:riboflavin kinase/FMN adenylyltransferase